MVLCRQRKRLLIEQPVHMSQDGFTSLEIWCVVPNVQCHCSLIAACPKCVHGPFCIISKRDVRERLVNRNRSKVEYACDDSHERAIRCKFCKDSGLQFHKRSLIAHKLLNSSIRCCAATFQAGYRYGRARMCTVPNSTYLL